MPPEAATAALAIILVVLFLTFLDIIIVPVVLAHRQSDLYSQTLGKGDQ